MRRTGPRLAWLWAAAIIVVTGCSADDGFDPLSPPEAGPPAPTTTTTVAVDYSQVALAPVEGTTTTTGPEIGPGPATLAGRVEGPEGPVAGATVRVERLVGDAVASADVVAAGDGGWSLPGVLGGRYRIRAWLAPDLAGVEPQILFVAGNGTTEVVLAVERFGGIVVESALAPRPPLVGQRTSLRVRVSQRLVDADGVVLTIPSDGVAMRLEPAAGWAVEPPAAAVTDPEGGVTFTVVCRAPGPQPLSVSLPDSVVALSLPDCASPAPPETTPPPATTATTNPPTTNP